MTLPREWSRGPVWASEAAQAEWAPVLARAQSAWTELELVSVPTLRDAALVHLDPDELPLAGRDCARGGLQLSVLARQADGRFRAAVHHLGAAGAWHAAWDAGDDDAIGAMLGFPPCCRAFFARTWGAGSCDPTPAMATVDGPWEANILLRWLGVRLVPYLPCSGACEMTLEQARLYFEHGQRAGLDVAAIAALLRLPVSYSALNGLAIIETLHFRVMAGADAEVDVRLARRGEDVPAPAYPIGSWEDNGFSSADAMEDAHAVVAAAAARAPYSSALDLGCGDGALLLRLAILAGAPLAGGWVGLDSDETRLFRGRLRHPTLKLVHGRIEDLGRARADAFDVVLLMPGRLLEMDASDAARVRDAVSGIAARLVLYAYGDQLERFGGLAGLAHEAGLEVTGEIFVGPGVSAADGRVSA